MRVLAGTEREKYAQNLGGKGAQLLSLENADYLVPKWFAISDEALAGYLSQNPPPEAQVGAWIEKFEFSEEFLQEIEAGRRRAGLGETKRFAVRSSASLEDLREHSFAGMYVTELFVAAADLPGAIRRVWASAFSERVQEYLRVRGLRRDQARIAVLIQEMIPADAAGVAFGLNPLTGETNEQVIEAVYGVGEGLVSGALDSDQYRVSEEQVHAEIREKREAYGLDIASGELRRRQLTHEEGSSSVLTEDQCRELSRSLRRLERERGGPQDVEFAICEGRIYYLQVRPITAVSRGKSTLWDNNNIIESYPGVTTPLTFSFVKKTYEIGYLQISEMIGISKRTLEKKRPLYSGMLGLIHGRFYYNLTNIREVIALVPGSKFLLKAFESAIGIDGERSADGQHETAASLFAFPRVLFCLTFQYWALPRAREKFVRDLEKVLEQARSRPLASLPLDELLSFYRELEKTVFQIWRAPPMNGLFTMLTFSLFRRMTEKWGLNETHPNLHNDLLVGEESIVSTEPIEWLIRLSRRIREDLRADEVFRTLASSELADRVRTVPDLSWLREEIEAYLEKYGERCIGGELKLETPSYRQDPTLFYQVLQSYVLQSVDLSFSHGRSAEIRDRAEQECARRLRGRPLRALLYRKLLRRCREMVVWRENLRFARTRAFGLVKAIYAEIGQKLAIAGRLGSARDIYFLSEAEVESLILDPTANWMSEIDARKARFARYEKETLPQRLRTWGDDVENFEPVDEKRASANGSSLQGVGCSSGVVRARIRVIRSPDEIESLEGQILVTESTDPGWVKLFPTASAILLERGSLLSHAGIVTREMGIPCVVGVKGLLKRVKTGDRVELNGATGQVILLGESDV